MQKAVIIGCGAMGQCHAQAYEDIEDVMVYAVVDTDQAKGEALAKQAGCQWVSNMSQLDAAQIDFVDICLPTHCHFPAILQASTITPNIICEKPLAIDPDQVDEIRNLVRKKGLRLMVAQVIRFWDCYVKARELVQSNVLGKVNSIICNRRQKRPEWSSGNWLSNESLSGGLAFDLMIHDIDYIVWLMGKPREVFGSIVYAEDGVPAHMKAQLYYDGCTVDAFASWGMPTGFADGGMRSSMEIIGQKAMISCDNTGVFTLTDSKGERTIELSKCDAYAEELRYFADCCRKGVSPVLADVDAVTVSLEVTRALQRSAEESHPVKLDE